MKSVVIIGSGNVASSFAIALSRVGVLRQIVARNVVSGQKIATQAGCDFSSDFGAIYDADLYIIAVSDRSLGEVSLCLNGKRGLVVHTAGSAPVSDLSEGIKNRGVLYPLQTFTTGFDVDFSKTPLFIECEDDALLDELESFASLMSSTVVRTTYTQRLELHLAAVFVCNFVNQMYVAGEELVGSLELLKPLIAQTASKVMGCDSAVPLQTGAAVRGDQHTMDRHIELLKIKAPKWAEVYKLLSEIIQNGKL